MCLYKENRLLSIGSQITSHLAQSQVSLWAWFTCTVLLGHCMYRALDYNAFHYTDIHVFLMSKVYFVSSNVQGISKGIIGLIFQIIYV